MADWSGGYVTDIEYIRSFHREQAPAHLDLVCLINGVAPPEPSHDRAYCDLGCGSAYGVSLLAACDPKTDFWGIDFNPAHIADGRAFQAECGLENLHLHEYSFSDLIEDRAPALPMFDHVALHGIYSWVGPDERKAIVRFLYRYLKPGGIVYLGYNSMPQWTPEMPFQRVLSTYGRFARGRSDRSVERGIAFAKQLREAGAYSLDRPEILQKLDELIASGRQRYLAHEYLTTRWTPMYHEDVADDLSAAKLDYVGSAQLLENFSQLMLTLAQRQLCDEIGSPEVAETLKDFFLRRSFRTDVYVRGKRHLSAAQQARRLSEINLCLLISADAARYEFTVPVGKSTLNDRLYEPIFTALDPGPMSIGELLRLPEVVGTTATAVEIAGMLLGTEQAIACVRLVEEKARRHAARFNAAAVARAIDRLENIVSLASPAARSGIHLTQMQALTFSQLASGSAEELDTIAAAIARQFSGQGAKLALGGKSLETFDEMLRPLREDIAAILRDSAPRWRQLGLLHLA